MPASLSTLYESAVVFGRASLVTDPPEKRTGLELLAVRFCGAVTPEGQEVIASLGSRTALVRIRIERISDNIKPIFPAEFCTMPGYTVEDP